MTIELANRLTKLRKDHGYSQEELAEKLGVSRQAISKWECAEASPDTDNLIALSKLYGISLDEIVNGKDESEEVRDGSGIDIGESHIHIKDDDGSEVHISTNGLKVNGVDIKDAVKKHKYEHIEEKVTFYKVLGAIEGVLHALAIIAFILCGAIGGLWYCAWVLVFVPEIIISIIRCFYKKRFCEFNAPFAAAFVFFFVCMWVPGLDANLWHPMWVVFLGIPAYYAIFGPIDALIKERKDRPHIIDVNIKD